MGPLLVLSLLNTNIFAVPFNLYTVVFYFVEKSSKQFAAKVKERRMVFQSKARFSIWLALIVFGNIVVGTDPPK